MEKTSTTPDHHWLLVKNFWIPIEISLQTVGATGEDANEKINSLKERLPKTLIDDLHYLRMQRNNLFHHDIPLENPTRWQSVAESALAKLELIEDGKKEPQMLKENKMDINNIISFTKARFLRHYTCTKEKQIVLLDQSTPIRLAPEGKTFINFCRDYTQFAAITIGPHFDTISVEDSLKTKDGISIEGKINVEFYVIDKEQQLKQFALNSSGEYKAFQYRAISSVQRILAKKNYDELDDFRITAPKEIINDYAENNIDETCAIKLTVIHLPNLDCSDADIRESRLNQKRLAKKEEVRILQSKMAVNSLEDELLKKSTEAKAEWEIQKLNLDLDSIKARHELNQKMDLAELLKTEHGQMAVNPELVYEYKIKKIEIERYIATIDGADRRAILKAILSHESGQNRTLRAVLENQYGLKLTDESNLAEEIIKLSPIENQEENKDDP